MNQPTPTNQQQTIRVNQIDSIRQQISAEVEREMVKTDNAYEQCAIAQQLIWGVSH